jgi:hypothetical protein
MPKKQTAWGANVWDVPEALKARYHGCGHALVAIRNDEIVAIQYLEDLSDDFYFDDDTLAESGETERDRLESILSDIRVGAAAKFLAEMGAVHVGMLSCHEFVEM